MLWTTFFLLVVLYNIFVNSFIIYSVSLQTRYTSSNTGSFAKSGFYILNLRDLYLNLLTPTIILILLNIVWSSPIITSWFGHLVFTSFCHKFSLIITLNFIAVFYILISSSYFTSQDFMDYLTVIYNFYVWLIVLYFANSIYTLIFVVELLSTLIFLLITTSSYSSNYFYNNLDISLFNYKTYSLPFSFLQSILFFFWISLIASLSLFFFLLFFYIKLLTFDWFLVEYIFMYFVQTKSIFEVYSLGVVFFIFLFCIFLKCGLAPLFIWKPTFFKGLSVSLLFFYVCLYYLFLFLLLVNVLLHYLHELFYYFVFVQTLLLSIGLFFLVFILCETFYLKSFLAISSILNSLIVFLALNNTTYVDFFLFI